MYKYLIAILLVAFTMSPAFGLDIRFTFEEDATDFPWIGREFTPGVVCGILYGLPENGQDVRPTSFEFLSDVSGVGVTSNYIFPVLAGSGGFDLVNGVVTGANLLTNFDDPTNGGMQIRFNQASWNVLHWNGGSGPETGMGNQNGFSGATYGVEDCPLNPGEVTEPVPVPAYSNWGLLIATLMLVLFGMWTLRRKVYHKEV